MSADMYLADRYVEHGVWEPGMRATSLLLQGFAVEVDRVFAIHLSN